MFAAAAPLPYYGSYGFAPAGRPASSKKPPKGSKDTSLISCPGTRSKPADGEGAAMLEPAIDGPPSSEKIRALNKQVQRASAVNSSQSSSLRSFATDSPSWEQALEHAALSRRSSQRSTSSSMPSRERPESVQLFGKTIFSRRSKARRESSANSSSGSSLYSADISLEAPAQASKEQYIPGLFGRMKGSKADAAAARARSNSASNKKLQISGPYNFQHVSHSRRDQPDMSPVHGHEFSPAGRAQDSDYQRLGRSDALGSHDNLEALLPVSPRRLPPQPSSPSRRSQIHDGSPRRLITRTRSSEQLRGQPARSVGHTRPPRSPAEHAQAISFPTVPPRLSSRLSVRPDGLDTMGAMTLDRPSTSGGFRQPQPFSIPENTPELVEEDTDVQAQNSDSSHSARFSHALTTPGDAAWPLPSTSASFSYEAALPDVPEEDEHFSAARRSRLSLASNSSSLRGSQSVPLLRLSAQLQASVRQRPPSGASDTLGRFDILTTRQASKGASHDDPAENPARESWEDDIDYCYEHEAEADCNFAWDRASLELVREEDSGVGPDAGGDGGASQALLFHDANDLERYTGDNHHITSLMPVPARHFDIPVFGSVSPGLSTNSGQLASTLTPVTSNFSHPRTYTSRRRTRDLHIRTGSHASSFKESHGFTLSPSLLIPGDFQQQMLMTGSQGIDTYHDDNVSPTHMEPSFIETSPAGHNPSGLFISERASTSTVDTNSSSQTSSSGERHISTNSNFTAPTRYTGSTTFEGWDPKDLESPQPLPFVLQDDATDLASPRSPLAPKSPLSESGDMLSHSTGDIRDELLRHDDMAQYPTKPKHRRQRANTTSSSTSTGGYALFPPAYNGNRV